jgi:hypothetical protein
VADGTGATYVLLACVALGAVVTTWVMVKNPPKSIPWPDISCQDTAKDKEKEDDPREKPDHCDEMMAICLLTALADKPGHIYGSNRCVFCREVCRRYGGWPQRAPTTTGSVGCNFWDYPKVR